MNVAFVADHSSDFLAATVEGLKKAFVAAGHSLGETADAATGIVVNVTRGLAPRANYLRKSKDTFVLTLAETTTAPADVRKTAYMALVRTLANLTAFVVRDQDSIATWLVTPELGCKEVAHDEDYARTLAAQALVLAGAHLIISNDFMPDLPQSLWQGDAVTRAMAEVGRELERLNLLPSILPIRELLPERDLRLIMKLYGLRQVSYGNMSARHDQRSFWMTGRGVNKGQLERIGKDILLVTGYDRERQAILLSVPTEFDPEARVSVDAIEHFQLYRDFPGIGAIIHLHAWIDGIASTHQSYPCGSQELADEVLTLVRSAPDPANAVVGLRNHGIVATGPDLRTVFRRLDGKLIREVPMA